MSTLLSLAHQTVAQHLFPGALALDATLGNGYDTLFLAQHVAPHGKVFGFDIQATAINATQTRLQNAELATCAMLYNLSHAWMQTTLPRETHGNFQAIMFNLGYLPGADKSIITTRASTLAALQASLNLLSPQGILSILAYPGHTGGDTETEAVQQWFAQLDTSLFHTNQHLSAHAKQDAPRLFLIKKSLAT